MHEMLHASSVLLSYKEEQEKRASFSWQENDFQRKHDEDSPAEAGKGLQVCFQGTCNSFNWTNGDHLQTLFFLLNSN